MDESGDNRVGSFFQCISQAVGVKNVLEELLCYFEKCVFTTTGELQSTCHDNRAFRHWLTKVTRDHGVGDTLAPDVVIKKFRAMIAWHREKEERMFSLKMFAMLAADRFGVPVRIINDMGNRATYFPSTRGTEYFKMIALRRCCKAADDNDCSVGVPQFCPESTLLLLPDERNVHAAEEL